MSCSWHTYFWKDFIELAKKRTDIARNLGKKILDKQIDKFNKEYTAGKGAGITLRSNEKKDIMKVIKFVENREILLNGTNKKITSEEGGFIRLLTPLITAGFPLMKSVLTSLAKSVLLLSGLSAAMSARDAAIQKKIYRSCYPSDLASRTAVLIILNEEMEDVMKIVKSFEESGLLIKGIRETIKNKAKNKNVDFFKYY